HGGASAAPPGRAAGELGECVTSGVRTGRGRVPGCFDTEVLTKHRRHRFCGSERASMRSWPCPRGPPCTAHPYEPHGTCPVGGSGPCPHGGGRPGAGMSFLFLRHCGGKWRGCDRSPALDGAVPGSPRCSPGNAGPVGTSSTTGRADPRCPYLPLPSVTPWTFGTALGTSNAFRPGWSSVFVPRVLPDPGGRNREDGSGESSGPSWVGTRRGRLVTAPWCRLSTEVAASSQSP